MLAGLLTEDPVQELGDDVLPLNIRFQASPVSAVDEILLSGRAPDGGTRKAAIAVRRAPSLIPSDEKSVRLIGSFLTAVSENWDEITAGRWRSILAAVTGSNAVSQAGKLAEIARAQESDAAFRTEIADGVHAKALRDRLANLDEIVAKATEDCSGTREVDVKELTWRLLFSLRVRELRLEGADSADRTFTVTRLRSATADNTPAAADMLFSKLCELAGRYAPEGASADANKLRRDLSGTALLASRRHASEGSVPGEDLPCPPAESAYLALVVDTAPDELIGREKDLKDWAEFCAGAAPYAWWQAGPWAGKTAMASWFVTHPPAGLDVVSFFITGLSGQADGDAFLDAMIEQLGGPSPGSQGSAVSTAARKRTMLTFLKSAAHRAEVRGRRLVVVVDGLDEDEVGAAPPSRGWPSIASLLPYRLPPGVRVIVTSRPDPGLPDDMPPGHPLLECTPRHLPASRVAQDREPRAKQELRDLLAGDQVGVSVAGYIAGSGGGLTLDDLSALTETPPRRLEPILRGVSGRSFSTRSRPDPRNPRADPAARVYLFAHRTLRATAEKQLGGELVGYRHRIHQWVGSYADDDWPDATPGYAIRGYPRMLAATADLTRLAALTRSPSRHAFLLKATGSDYTALTEIRIAQDLLTAESILDLRALVELAAYRHAILIRNQCIPPELPAMWAKLARFGHAEALARTTDPSRRAEALAGVATAAAQAGDLDRARRLVAEAEVDARTVDLPSSQAAALAETAAAAAWAGEPDRARQLAAEAETLARTFAIPGISMLAGPAAAIAQAGDLDRAETLARSITDPRDQVHALAGVAAAARPDRSPGPRPPASSGRRGPRPRNHRPIHPGRHAHLGGYRGRPDRRPGPRPPPSGGSRGQGQRHHQSQRQGTRARCGGYGSRPGRRPGPRRGPGPVHHRPLGPGHHARRADFSGYPRG